MNVGSRTCKTWRAFFFVSAGLLVAGAACTSQDGALQREPVNVILMVADGAGFNAFNAASYYEHGALGRQVYDDFPVRLACTTYALEKDGEPAGYAPECFWGDFACVRGNPGPCKPTDSAAAATALNTGVKTKSGRLGVDAEGEPLPTVAELATAAGKRAGTISSVQLCHATPAGVWAHNVSRSRYKVIASEMILESRLSVIMGAGNPGYDNDGRPVEEPEYRYVGGESIWMQLVTGTTAQGWTLIEKKGDFAAIADGTIPIPRRLIGVPQVRETLQYNRSGDGMGDLNLNVPTLATMSRAALNVLAKDNPDGFYLMIEGGAVDWANHRNRLARMIEEQMDFNRAVEAVVEWVETNSDWEHTLLIVTSDHECGMIWGPGSYIDKDGDGHFTPDADEFVAYKPIVNNGRGRLPGVQYGSGSHTNALVPLLVKGRDAETFYERIRGRDERAAEFWNLPDSGYVDNTDIFAVMRDVLVGDQSATADRTERCPARCEALAVAW